MFIEFWNAYPRKQNKPSAVRAYGKIKPMSREVMDKILSGIERYKNSGQWGDKQFIPHPATFLNNRKWEDEIDTISKTKGGEHSDAWKRAWDRQYHYEDGTCTRYSEGD